MSFIRAKEIPPRSGNWYDYEVKSVRKGNKVTQEVIRYIGPSEKKTLSGVVPKAIEEPIKTSKKASSVVVPNTPEISERKKLIAKIKRAKDYGKKTDIWQDADLLKSDAEVIVRDMVLSLPKGYYKLHDRQYGTNIVDKVYEIYGLMPSIYVNEPMMLGLQALYPDKVYASFTHNLDAIEIK